MVQKDGRKAFRIEASVRLAKAGQKCEPDRMAITYPMADKSKGATVCQRRSPVTSECQAFKSIAPRSAMYGKTVRNVTARLDMPEVNFKNVGSQMARA